MSGFPQIDRSSCMCAPLCSGAVLWKRSSCVRWIASLRESEITELRTAAILIRPHPARMEEWKSIDLSRFEHVALYGSNPMDAPSKEDYFESLHYSAVVVGLNTSAFLEAAIVDRPVHTILAPSSQTTSREHSTFTTCSTSVEACCGRAPASRSTTRNWWRRSIRRGPHRARIVGSCVSSSGLTVCEKPATPVFCDALEGIPCAPSARTRADAVAPAASFDGPAILCFWCCGGCTAPSSFATTGTGPIGSISSASRRTSRRGRPARARPRTRNKTARDDVRPRWRRANRPSTPPRPSGRRLNRKKRASGRPSPARRRRANGSVDALSCAHDWCTAPRVCWGAGTAEGHRHEPGGRRPSARRAALRPATPRPDRGGGGKGWRIRPGAARSARDAGAPDRDPAGGDVNPGKRRSSSLARTTRRGDCSNRSSIRIGPYPKRSSVRTCSTIRGWTIAGSPGASKSSFVTSDRSSSGRGPGKLDSS